MDRGPLVLTIVFISLLFSVFYYFGPNRELPLSSFLAASLRFSFYVANSAITARPTAVAGTAILIFWLHLTGIAVQLGAEINAEAERQAAA